MAFCRHYWALKEERTKEGQKYSSITCSGLSLGVYHYRTHQHAISEFIFVFMSWICSNIPLHPHSHIYAYSHTHTHTHTHIHTHNAHTHTHTHTTHTHHTHNTQHTTQVTPLQSRTYWARRRALETSPRALQTCCQTGEVGRPGCYKTVCLLKSVDCAFLCN